MFVRKLEYQAVRHLHNDDPGFAVLIRAGEYLAFRYAVQGWLIVFYLSDPARLQSPCMVDKDLCINPKYLVEIILGMCAVLCQLTHSMDPYFI